VLEGCCRDLSSEEEEDGAVDNKGAGAGAGAGELVVEEVLDNGRGGDSPLLPWRGRGSETMELSVFWRGG